MNTHKMADGEPKYTNRLVNESSPYLQKHAHNPVDWFPWGEEAFKKARDEDKPIHLSVGYASCHWCAVLERESFEDEAIAKLMNENFVNIKVDREERPDIDNIYMTAVQAMTGGGGWPSRVLKSPASLAPVITITSANINCKKSPIARSSSTPLRLLPFSGSCSLYTRAL